jgi:hypothetical protein
MNNASVLRSAGLVKATLPRVYDLYNKVDKIQNYAKVPILDLPINKVRQWTGSTVITDYESLRNAVIQEVNTALSGTSVASDYRIKLELENLKSEMTPAQHKAAINNLISALRAREEASEAVVYPWEVVKGIRTMEDWKKQNLEEAEAVKKIKVGGEQKPTSGKRVVEKFFSKKTGKTKYVYEDGTEEIK